MNDYTLHVKEPWFSMIVDGRKTYEGCYHPNDSFAIPLQRTLVVRIVDGGREIYRRCKIERVFGSAGDFLRYVGVGNVFPESVGTTEALAEKYYPRPKSSDLFIGFSIEHPTSPSSWLKVQTATCDSGCVARYVLFYVMSGQDGRGAIVLGHSVRRLDGEHAVIGRKPHLETASERLTSYSRTFTIDRCEYEWERKAFAVVTTDEAQDLILTGPKRIHRRRYEKQDSWNARLAVCARTYGDDWLQRVERRIVLLRMQRQLVFNLSRRTSYPKK